MKKRILVLIGLVMIFVLACGDPKNHIAVKDFEKQLKAVQTGDMNEIGKVLGKEIKKGSDEEIGLKILQEPFKRIEYKINDVKKNGDTITINTTLKGPDLSGVTAELEKELMKLVTEKPEEFAKYNAKQLENLSFDVMKKIIDEKLKSKDLKTIEKTVDVKYKKVGNTWKEDDNDEFVNFLTFGMNF